MAVKRSGVNVSRLASRKLDDGGKGLARDTRVRWALEEAGLPYEVRLVSFHAMKESAHLALHPFGQIPTYQEGGLALFETGSIVFHIAERHAGLLPDDADARARAISAGDLMMVSVLLRLKSSGIMDGVPNLAAYVARGEARPAYERAFDAQLAVYTGRPPTG
jgi:glutathione S-transferase